MKVLFAFFDTYTEAKEAVDELLEHDFDFEEMNAIVLEEVAKNNIETRLDKVDVGVTDAVDGVTVHGLDRLLGGQRAVRMPGMDDIYAAGTLATVIAKTAAAPGAADGGLRAALADFNVLGPVAQDFFEGVQNGGVLFWIRVDDEQAHQATEVLETANGRHVGSYAG